MSYFDVSHGHTYHKPVHKFTSHSLNGASQQSKETTPLPGNQASTGGKPASNGIRPHGENESDGRTLWDALRMTLQHGKEYTDDVSLVGEPGNFRFSRHREAAASQSKSQPQGPSTGTPIQSRAASVLPGAKSPGTGLVKGSKPGEKATSMPDGPAKIKRRKSKAGEPSP